MLGVPTLFTDATDDTYQALLKAWLADSFLPTVFPEPIHAGRLRSHEGALSLAPPGIDPPYAQMMVEQGKPHERNTGIFYQDYRFVTITAVGDKTKVSQALTRMGEIYHRGLLPYDLAYAINGIINAGGFAATLVYPYYSARKFVRWWADGRAEDGILEQDESTRKGKDVWRAVLTGTIWSTMAE
jgi:hypothetical protein